MKIFVLNEIFLILLNAKSIAFLIFLSVFFEILFISLFEKKNFIRFCFYFFENFFS